HRSGICTIESADHFSYRREGTTGRLAGYVWLAPASPCAVVRGAVVTGSPSSCC
ncbi:laccase domain-containing protein, partial [Streptomyces niveus]